MYTGRHPHTATLTRCDHRDAWFGLKWPSVLERCIDPILLLLMSISFKQTITQGLYQLLISLETALIIYNNQQITFPSSFLLFVPPFAVTLFLCSECTLIGGFLPLIFRPLPLQLPQQIRSQQPVSDQATSQRAVHRPS